MVEWKKGRNSKVSKEENEGNERRSQFTFAIRQFFKFVANAKKIFYLLINFSLNESMRKETRRNR